MQVTAPAAVDLSLPSLREAYREGRFTPRTLLAALHAHAASLNLRHRLYITLLTPSQLEPYLSALDGRGPESLPLYGIPFAISDNIDLAGVRTTAGCEAYAYTPSRSAAVVERLIELGAIPTGKTNLDQFAAGLDGQRSPYGECPNAWLERYISGGSCSGSALAVALGLASFALGTDSDGSTRVPAALNHLVGLKPSRGIVSTRGVVPACRGLDCVGFLTQQASEASELLALTARLDDEDLYSRRNPASNERGATQPRPFRFGLPRAADLHWFGCDQGPVLFADALDALESIGGTAVEIDFTPFLDAARLLHDGPWIAERDALARELLERDPQALLPSIRQRLEAGRRCGAADAFEALHHVQRLRRDADRLMDGLDCLLTPTLPRAPSRDELCDERRDERRDGTTPRHHELATYSGFANLLDYAAVAVPAGFQKNGLPWGVSLFGRAFTDQYLLGVAQALQTQLALPTVTGRAAPLVVLPAAPVDALSASKPR